MRINCPFTQAEGALVLVKDSSSKKLEILNTYFMEPDYPYLYYPFLLLPMNVLLLLIVIPLHHSLNTF